MDLREITGTGSIEVRGADGRVLDIVKLVPRDGVMEIHVAALPVVQIEIPVPWPEREPK